MKSLLALRSIDPPFPSESSQNDTLCARPAYTVRCSTFRNWLGGGGKSAGAAAAATTAATAGGAARTGTGVSGGRGGGGAAGGAEAGDAKLLKLGLGSTTDRRRVMAVVMREEENPSFINWFEVGSIGRLRASERDHSWEGKEREEVVQDVGRVR